ncbi:MAG: ribonuclease P protein component [Gammaproteobacteria bacterium]|nr:ribonuclease P protein component [Gammaproteobacteria bacterium]
MLELTGNFSRSKRLLKPGEFKQVFDHSTRSSDSNLTVFCRPNSQGNARLGLAISKKQLKRAVDRNRIKRLVRESFRQHQFVLSSLDLVVLARRSIHELDNRQVLHALERHWQRVIKRCADSSSI